MTRLKQLHAFCTKLEHYPSRLAIQGEIERLLAEEAQEPAGGALGESIRVSDRYAELRGALCVILNEGLRVDFRQRLVEALKKYPALDMEGL